MLDIKFPEKPQEDMTWTISKVFVMGEGPSKQSADSLSVSLKDRVGNTVWQTILKFSRPYYSLDDEYVIMQIEGQVHEKWALKVYRDSLDARLFGEY